MYFLSIGIIDKFGKYRIYLCIHKSRIGTDQQFIAFSRGAKAVRGAAKCFRLVDSTASRSIGPINLFKINILFELRFHR